MDDLEQDSDLSKYAALEEDKIKPIDVGGGGAPAGATPAKKPKDAPEDMSLTDTVLLSPEQMREKEEQAKKDAARAEEVKSAFEHDTRYIKNGEYMDLIEKVPHLRRVMIGVGWQKRLVEGEYLDVDISIFLLDKNGLTRIDEDFVFYNTTKACDGAVNHLGDSRAGSGDGDDQSIMIDLNGLPFDIMKVVFVYSLYDPDIKGHHFGMIRKIFFRLTNKDDGHEILRYLVDDEDHKGGNALIVGTMIREGPKWIFEASCQTLNGGLARVAQDYGIIIKELQGTGENAVGDFDL